MTILEKINVLDSIFILEIGSNKANIELGTKLQNRSNLSATR